MWNSNKAQVKYFSIQPCTICNLNINIGRKSHDGHSKMIRRQWSVNNNNVGGYSAPHKYPQSSQYRCTWITVQICAYFWVTQYLHNTHLTAFRTFPRLDALWFLGRISPLCRLPCPPLYSHTRKNVFVIIIISRGKALEIDNNTLYNNFFQFPSCQIT